MSEQEPEHPLDGVWDELLGRREDCPDPKRIRQYLDGQLEDEDASTLKAHIESCGHCTAQLGRLYKSRKSVETAREELERVRARITRPVVPWRKVLRVAAALVFAIALGCSLPFAYDLYVNRPVRMFWKPLLTPAPDVVVGSAEVVTRDGLTRTDYLGVGDVQSLAAFSSLILDMTDREQEVNFRTSAEVGRLENLGKTAVIVGGPSVNPLALQALSAARGVDPTDTKGLKQGYRFVGAQGLEENTFLAHTTDSVPKAGWGIEDVATGELASCTDGASVALVVRMRLEGPDQPREILVVAGYMGPDTYVSARSLVTATEVLEALGRTFEREGYAEMVLDIRDGKATVHRFPTAANPRGR